MSRRLRSDRNITFRGIICWLLVALTPASLTAADAGAVLYGKGTVLRNGTEIQDSSALFAGDLIETKADSMANLNSLGTSVVILPNSLVEFQAQSLSLEHGSVSVATSHGISVRVGCMTIVPATSAWTQFEVTDVNGTVHVAAKKNDVRLQAAEGPKAAKETSTSRGDLREGEETTRDESDGCKAEKKDAGAIPPGSGNILSSPWVRYGALAGVGIALCLTILCKSTSAASPWQP